MAVVVVNYGSHDLLDADHFEALSGTSGVELVVVDNLHSADERVAVARVCRERGFDLLALDTNTGFGAAVNRGVAHARRSRSLDAVVLLNPDAVLERDVLVRLAETVAADAPQLLCPTVLKRDGSTWFGGGELLMDHGRTRTAGVDVTRAEHPWVTGACLAFQPDLWDRLGGFDERYFMYWEDIDLSFRARRLGARVVVDRELTVLHDVGATQGSVTKSDLYRRYNCRNRLLFAAVSLPRRRAVRWVLHAPGYAWLILRRDGKRPLVRRPVSMLWSVLRGTAEGVAFVLRGR
ncbi:glycosyltransferase family 2 protein [Solicola sp. PLA-1-18]|uniref:glycosyltransferase family 2 protein n=1 Tax=Solicola sp. PLA-1-18 TaxID=3380532 RepID=UPI003B828C98